MLSSVREALPQGILCHFSGLLFLVCSEPLPSISQACLRRCYPPVRLCKPKRCCQWKRDVTGVLLHLSNQGLRCPRRFRSRYPPGQRSPPLNQTANLVSCSVWVSRPTPHTCAPHPGYETFQKAHKHKGHETFFTGCFSHRWWLPCCAPSQNPLTVQGVHYCPTPLFTYNSVTLPVTSWRWAPNAPYSLSTWTKPSLLSLIDATLRSHQNFPNRTYWPVNSLTTWSCWSILCRRRYKTLSLTYLCPPRDRDILHFNYISSRRTSSNVARGHR